MSALTRTLAGNEVVWVIVDRLAKSAHFIPLRVGCSLEKTIDIYIREIVRLHGVPVDIVLDRDPRFIIRFWQSLHEAFDKKLQFNTTFHHQADGQSERR